MNGPCVSIAGSAFWSRPGLAGVLAALDGAGEEARVVGGAVRNTLMGLSVSDVDIATTALPQEAARRASDAGFRVVPTGINHGTRRKRRREGRRRDSRNRALVRLPSRIPRRRGEGARVAGRNPGPPGPPARG